MARYRWTIALIIICLPILATVITAFRIRDLPKGSNDPHKSTVRTRKCEDCDVNELKVGQRSVKIESEQKFEPAKKSVIDKKKINPTSYSKTSFQFKDDSEGDDSDDSKVSKTQNLKGVKLISEKQDKVSVKTGPTVKQEPVKKVFLKFDDDEEDDYDNDDDDDDDDEVPHVLITPSVLNNKPKPSLTESKVTTKEQPKKLNIQSIVVSMDDDDDDDDDDDEDDNEGKNSGIAAARKILSDLNAAKTGGKIPSDDQLKKGELLKKSDTINTKKDKDKKNEVQHDKNKDSTQTPTKLDREVHSETKKAEQTPTKSDKAIHSEIKKAEQIKKDKSTDIKYEEVQKIKKVNDESKDKITKPEPKKDTTPVTENKKESKPIKDDKTIKKEVVQKAELPKDTTYKEHREVNKEDDKLRPKRDVPSEERVKEDKASKDHRETKKEEVKKQEKKDLPEKPVKSKEDKTKITSKETESKKEHKPVKNDKSSVEDAYSSHEDRNESHRKQVSDAVRRRNLLQSEFEDFYAFFPTFAPNFSKIHNPECRRHGQILLRQLRGNKLWALHMLDATAKIPSGLLQGNGIQLGDFDQCLDCRARVQLDTGSVVRVQGKYCLARLDIRAEAPELEVPVHLAQAKNLIKSRIDDPGHFVPRFSTLSWGACVPAACDPQDVEVVIKDALLHYQHTSGLVIRVKIDKADCHVTPGGDWWEPWMETPTLVTLSFYGVVLFLVLVATAQDFLAGRKSETEDEKVKPDDQAECDQKETEEVEKEVDSKRPDGFLSAFSLYRTISKLIAPESEDEIACIHGIRGLATIALLVAHKFLPVAVMPYTNRTKIAEIVSSPLWSWCRAGWIFTDCFLLLSGALMAHRVSETSSAAPRRLLSRYLRLTPALLAVVLFYAYVWDHLSSGPMWGTLVTKNAEICQESWWWNIFYVQNYFGFEEMCAPQTHQLALDMQLTIIGSIIVWGMYVNGLVTKLVLLAVHLLAAYSRYTTTRDHRLTMLAYQGVSVSQLYRTANMSYTSTFHRSTPYLIGLSLGLLLKKPSTHGKIVVCLGWAASAALCGGVLRAGARAGAAQHRYSAHAAALYAASAPVASALAFAWLIYVLHSGHCECLSRLLRWRPLVLVSRLSYALYLCQFIVFLSIAGTVRSSREFTIMSLIDVEEISAVLLSSIVLTLTLVIPMQSLHKISFRFASSAVKDSEEEENSETTAEKTNEEVEEKEEIVENDIIEVPQIRSRQHLIAHREVLEEIPEVEVEYEMQREQAEGLEGILEEEEDEDIMEEEVQERDDDELEIIEEEQGGEDDFWGEREEYPIRRPYSRNHDNDQDLDEWEWTTNGNSRNGAQYYRYSR